MRNSTSAADVMVWGMSMNISEMSPEDRDVILTFVDMARDLCTESSWEDVEPQLQSCWYRVHRKTSAMIWHDIAAHVKGACDGMVC
jgi:hypothetical protein